MGIVNIDDDLHEQIRKASTVSSRSINAQAAFLDQDGHALRAESAAQFNEIVSLGTEAGRSRRSLCEDRCQQMTKSRTKSWALATSGDTLVASGIHLPGRSPAEGSVDDAGERHGRNLHRRSSRLAPCQRGSVWLWVRPQVLQKWGCLPWRCHRIDPSFCGMAISSTSTSRWKGGASLPTPARPT